MKNKNFIQGIAGQARNDSTYESRHYSDGRLDPQSYKTALIDAPVNKSFIYLIILLLIIPICRWVVLPFVEKIPDNFLYEANVFSIDNFYDEKKSRYTGNVLSVTRFSYKVAEKNGKDLIIKNCFDVKKPSGDKIFSVERFYGINPHTHSHVKGKGDRDRWGYLFAPRGIKKGDNYTYWHINYNAPAEMRFQKEEIIAGLKAYKYVCSYKADQTENLGHLPGVPENRGIELQILLETWIDPVTGWLIKYEDHATAWFYDIKTNKKLKPWNQFHNKFTHSSVLKNIEKIELLQFKRNLLLIYIPVTILAVSILILLINFSLIKTIKIVNPALAFLLIFVIGGSLSCRLYLFLNHNDREKQLFHFENESTKIISYINMELDRVQDLMRDLHHDFEQTGNKMPQRDWFRNKADYLLRKSYLINAFGFIPIITSSERKEFEALAKKEGFSDFQITEQQENGKLVKAGERSFYAPVYYIEPYAENKLVLGFDLASDSNRLKTIKHSEESGSFSITPPISLIQWDQPIENDKGLIIYYPLFLNSKFEKRKLTGYFSCVFSINTLINIALNTHDLNKDIRIRINDFTEKNKVEIFMNLSGNPDNGLSSTRQFQALNRHWEYNFFLPPIEVKWINQIIFLICILLTAISGYLSYRLLSDNSKQLKETQNYTRSLFEASLDPLLIINSHGKITDLNDASVLITGIPREKLLGTDFSNYFTDQEKAEAGYQQVFEKGFVADYSLTIKNVNGKLTDVLYNSSVYKNSRGEIQGVFAAARDISTQKKLFAELSNANKELEQFAFISSHDLQEPLRTIANFTGLLDEKYSGKSDPQTDQFLGFIKTGVSRMQNLIKDLLEFSRLGKNHNFTIVDCNGVLNEVLSSLHASVSECNALITYYNLPKMKGNETELKQLFQNLISNSIKFRRKGVAPEINILSEEKDGEYQFIFNDNGIGIEEQYFERIFIIFQRLHNATEYPGTGIGLATCKKIIDLHLGKIWLQSKPGKGTTFYFTISKNI